MIDFPDTPTQGDEFTVGLLTWVFDDPVWLLKTSGASGGGGGPDTLGFTFATDTPPTATRVGDTWFNTATGNAYVWFDNRWVMFSPGGGAASPTLTTGAYQLATASGSGANDLLWAIDDDGGAAIYDQTASRGWFVFQQSGWYAVSFNGSIMKMVNGNTLTQAWFRFGQVGNSNEELVPATIMNDTSCGGTTVRRVAAGSAVRFTATVLLGSSPGQTWKPEGRVGIVRLGD
jgi:hypothetical protein